MIQPEQCKAARALLRWDQKTLAARANVNIGTISDFEGRRRSPHPSTVKALKDALEAAGIVFSNGDEPGVKLFGRSAGI
jgi:transcriptional regulator with XRE-family HTH domain